MMPFVLLLFINSRFLSLYNTEINEAKAGRNVTGFLRISPIYHLLSAFIDLFHLTQVFFYELNVNF